MSIFCTLNRNSSYEKTEYRVLDASHGFASIEKRNPAWLDDASAFDVPVGEIAVIILVDDETGARTEFEPITVQDAFDLDGLNKQASARAWHETHDVER